MKKTKVLLLFMIVVFFIAFFFQYQCPFQRFLHIACPSCGLTRSFIAIFHFDFITAIQYNLLGIPLFIFSVISIFLLGRDVLKKQDAYFNQLYAFMTKYSVILLIILIMNMIINNIKNI